MLRTNLATRPFYNDRLVRTLLALIAMAAFALTAFNVFEVIRLQARTSEARQTIAQNDAQARALRAKAADVRRSVDAVQLERVQAAAREANALIDRRTFSWTELLNQFQTTLPADVRIGGVIPQLDSNGRRLVQVTVFSRRVEDLETFMDALEKTGMFSDVLPRSDSPEADGTIRSELQAYYEPLAGKAAAQPVTSEPGNQQPANASAASNPGAGEPR